MSHAVDYYKVLQVGFGADKNTIASSYKRLCKIYHPDINSDPAAEETMKQINKAYSILCDDIKRRAYNSLYGNSPKRYSQNFDSRAEKTRRSFDNEAAASVMDSYFSCLIIDDFQKAYEFLSDFDKQYVTIQSFGKWRDSVSRLFSIRNYSISLSDPMALVKLDEGKTVQGKKFALTVWEKNLITQESSQYQVDKYAINESGKWKIFLGYRDLNEIAQMFHQMGREQEQGEMEKLWESFCLDNCRGLDMLSRRGFLKDSSREIYRSSRYNQPLTVAVFSIRPCFSVVSGNIKPTIIETAAKTLSGILRETDIPGYLGDGLFAVLFVELKKRHASVIIQRAAEKISLDVKARINQEARVDYCFTPYVGKSLDDLLDKLIAEI